MSEPDSRAGRKNPYWVHELHTIPCVRCGKTPSGFTWKTCADGVHRPLCRACDIELNEMVLIFLRDPNWDAKMEKYIGKA